MFPKEEMMNISSNISMGITNQMTTDRKTKKQLKDRKVIRHASKTEQNISPEQSAFNTFINDFHNNE